MSRSAPTALALALICVSLAAAILAACSERTPTQFPHLVHLTGVACGKRGPACLGCNSCHGVSAAGDREQMPGAQLCASCHRTDLARVSATIDLPRAHDAIDFDHDRHLGMKSIQGQCVMCHAGVVKPGAAPLPAMKQCFSCHEHEAQWQAGQCKPCHASADLARTLPRTFLRHEGDFARHHGQFAVEDRKLCQSCHTQKQCNDCHDTSQDLSIERRRPERVDQTRIHQADFLTRHALEAQAEPARCARCHAPETCESCHLERGVSALGLGARNPHPPGWVGNDPNASSSHGREARRDILLCASCHDQGPATNCIRCHKVGGYGGNPHPSGWRSARTPEQGMCRYCHE